MSDLNDDDFLEPWDLHVLLQHVVELARDNQDLYRRTQFALSRIMREFAHRRGAEKFPYPQRR